MTTSINSDNETYNYTVVRQFSIIAETQHLRTLLTPPVRPSAERTDAQNRAMLYQLGEDIFADLVLLGWAAASPADDAPWADLSSLPDRLPIPDFPVRGEDVLALGVPSGQIVGELLSDVERWWIDNDFEPDRPACLERLKLEAP